MKLSQAFELKALGELSGVQLIRSPSQRRRWLIMLTDKSGRSSLLADEQGDVILSVEIEKPLELLKSMGFHKAEITI